MSTIIKLLEKHFNKILFVIFFILLFSFQQSKAQTAVPMSSQVGLSYTENFASISTWTNNFASGTGASRWGSVAVTAGVSIPDGVKTTTSTATFTTATAGGVQRGTDESTPTQTIELLATGATSNTSAVAIDFFVDFTGVNAGTLSFDWARVNNSTGDRGGSLRVYTSTNGTAFTELTTAAVNNIINNGGTASGSITTVALPSGFNNVSTARIRFYYFNGTTTGTTGSRPKISIDNVNVTATPITTITQLTTGLATSPLNSGVSNNAVFGFSASATGTPNLTAFNIGTTSTTVSKLTNIKLFRSTDNSYATAGDNTQITTGLTINQTATQLQFSGLTEALGSTAKNYFIVADIDPSVTSSTTAFTPSLTNANLSVSSGTVGSATLTGTAFSFAASVFSVSYSGNGNTGGSAPSTVNANYNSSITLSSAGTLVRSGYSFNVWNTAANGSGSNYAAGASFTIPFNNTTMYAQWNINSYTVSYSGNGSDGGTAPSSTSANYNSVIVLPGAGSLTRTGYSFNGWNTAADGTGTAYNAGDNYTIPAIDVTLYAQWSLANVYTVTYLGNGNTAGAVPIDGNSYTAISGYTVTVLGPNTLTRTGYTFAGWNTAANGSGTSYVAGNTFTIGANTSLYAQWTINSYSVAYDGNGNTGGTAPSTQSGNYNSSLTLNGVGTLTRTGYTFTGWNTAADGTGTGYSAGASFTVPANNSTLYAQWSINNYSVIYNGNGSTGGAVPTTQTANYNSSVTISAEGTLVRTGYSFTGWNTAADGTGTGYSAGAGFTISAINTTLYAQWSINSYTVTYNGNGNTGGTAPATQSGNFNTSITISGAGSLVKSGNTFQGWNTAADGSGTSYAAAASFTMPAQNTILYAQWGGLIFVTENFEDGNISASPVWSGNTSSFTINNTSSLSGTYDLRGNTAGANSTINTQIGNSANLAVTDLTWSFLYQDGAGNPGGAPATSTNGWRLWLAANGTNPATAQGYALRQGNSGTPDNVQFVRMNAGVETVVITGTVDPGTSIYSIKVTRSSAGGWSLFMNSGTGGATTQIGATTTDITYLNSGSSSIYMLLNASNSTGTGNPNRFRFDNINFFATTYNVTYNNNLGTGTQTDGTAYTSGSTVTVLSAGSISRTGYVFAGWNTAANGSGTAYQPNVTFSITNNVTLYAQWIANPVISAPSSVCAGSSSNSATVTTTTNAAYNWSISGGSINSGQSTSSISFTAGTSGSVVLNCQVTYNGVSTGAQSQTISINEITAISTDALPLTQTVYINSIPDNLTVSATGANLTYQWKLSPGGTNATGTGNNTNSFTPPTSGSVGSQSYYCTVSGTCGSVNSRLVTVTFTDQNVWKGGGTSQWNLASNWQLNTVPSSSTNAAVPVNNTPYPVLTATSNVKNLQIDAGATIDLNGNSLTINGTVTGTGTLSGSFTSSLVMGAASSGTVYFTSGANTLRNLTINGGATTLGNALNIAAGVAGPSQQAGVVTLASGATLVSNGNLTLKSNQYGTARVASLPVNGSGVALATITGNVTIERYVSNNGGFRAWRLLSVPTIGSQTFKQAWQEGQAAMANGVPNYGTILTSTYGTWAANGYDAQTTAGNLLLYNNSTSAYAEVSNTNNSMQTTSGYYVYIRGDRSVSPSSNTSAATATTLRTTGTLYMGDQSAFSVGANRYALVGNIYPSSVDFTLLEKSTGLQNAFYVWDPKVLTGTSQTGTSLGGYNTFSATNFWEPTAATGSYPSGQANTLIESGQAFFVYNPSTTTTNTIRFKEAAKATGNNYGVFRPANITRLKTYLYGMAKNGSTPMILDGNVVVFDNKYSAEVDVNDAVKMTNTGANIGIARRNQVLAVEGRPELNNADTVYFDLANMKQQQYQFEFTAQNLDKPGMTAYLEDSYLNTKTPVALNATTTATFNVDANAGSSARNRFRIVFSKTKQPLSITKGSIAITPNPVEGSVARIQFNNLPAGTYNVRILNNAGQLLFTKLLTHAGGTAIQSINLPQVIGKGAYQLKVISVNKALDFSDKIFVLGNN